MTHPICYYIFQKHSNKSKMVLAGGKKCIYIYVCVCVYTYTNGIGYIVQDKEVKRERKRNLKYNRDRGTSLVAQWLELHASCAMGSIPGGGSRSHMSQLRVYVPH